MTARNLRNLFGATALAAASVALAMPASAEGIGLVSGSATFQTPTCTSAGKQVAVTIHDGSSQGGATYTVQVNIGSVTPNSMTLFDGESTTKTLNLSGDATQIYVYADGSLVGQSALAKCSATPSTSSTTSTRATATRSSTSHVTHSSTSSTTRSSTSVAAPTSTSTAAPTSTSSTSTPTSTTSTTHTTTSTPVATSSSTHTATKSTMPPSSTAAVVPGPAPTSSVQMAPKTNPQGSAGPLKWGGAIVLALGGLALAATYFRREFKR